MLFAEVCVLTVVSLLLFSVEMSGHDMVCFDKTFEAAEALLHMESPGGLHSERNTGQCYTQQSVRQEGNEVNIDISSKCYLCI